MGATLWTSRAEYYTLWILTAAYFITACLLLFATGWYNERQKASAETEEEQN